MVALSNKLFKRPLRQLAKSGITLQSTRIFSVVFKFRILRKECKFLTLSKYCVSKNLKGKDFASTRPKQAYGWQGLNWIAGQNTVLRCSQRLALRLPRSALLMLWKGNRVGINKYVRYTLFRHSQGVQTDQLDVLTGAGREFLGYILFWWLPQQSSASAVVGGGTRIQIVV